LKNEQIFDCLFALKDQIEQEMGTKLSWEHLEDKRACRIAACRDGDIDADTEELATIRKWAIETLLKLKAVFPKRIENCTKPPQT
jgi:Domain of unknown function (DUF4268)